MPEIEQIFDVNEAKKIRQVGKELKATDKILLKTSENAMKLSQILKASGISYKELTKVQNKNVQTSKQLDAVGKQLVNTENQLKQLSDKRYEQIAKQRLEIQKQRQAVNLLVKAQMAQRGSTKQLQAVVSILYQRLQNTNQATEAGRQKAERLRGAIDRLNKKITQNSDALTRQKRNIGNYGSAMSGLGMKVRSVAMQFAGALGLTSAVFLFVNVLKGAFNTIRSFTKEQAVLAGVLGKTRKEVKDLTNQSIELGAIYPVTASEVTQLQISYARLGFTMSEISNLTEATIRGSIALNASLDETATLVGAIVRAFDDLTTQDSAHIIDVMTLATQRTSLSFEGLKTAVPKVAAAANAMNISLETMASHLGIAHDTTLDASTAGTSLRNLYLDLTRHGLTLDEALNKINSSTNKVRTAYEMFGKRTAIVALGLANNTERARELNKEFDEAGDVAQRVAEEQMATLDGALKSVASSWEKLILSMKEGEGTLSKIAQSVSFLLDVLSSDEFNLVDLTMNPRRTMAIMQTQKVILDSVKNANKDRLEDIYASNIKEANEGDKFSKKLIDAVVSRYKVLEQAELDAQKRKNKLTMQAELEKEGILAQIRDFGVTDTERQISEITKKYDELIAQAKKFGIDTSDIEKEKQIEISAIVKQEQDERLNKLKEEKEKRIQNWVEETKRRAELKNEQLEHQKEIEKQISEIVEGDMDSVNDKLQDSVEESLKMAQELANQKTEIEKKQAEEELQIAENLKNAKYDIAEKGVQALFELNGYKFENELNQLEQEKQAKLNNEKLTLEQRAQIEAEYEQKAAKLKERQARSEKLSALFTIAINTAKGVSDALSKVVTAPLVPFIIAQGVLQAAVVAARPIPKFAKGTQHTPSEFIAGEKGRELVQWRTGQLQMVEKPSYFKGNEFRGATVFSNPETERILAKSGNNVSFDTEGLKNEMIAVRKAIINKPVLITDKDYRVIGKRKNAHREIYLNRLMYGD